MPDPFYIEWDYYMQGYRLHQRATKAANSEAQRLLQLASDIAHANNREIPRADGLKSFVALTAKLNGWPDLSTAKAMVAQAKKDIARPKSLIGEDQTLLNSAVAAINSLDDASSLTQTVNAAIAYFASVAVAIDPDDFDNHWSAGTSRLYIDRDFDGAYESYDEAHDLAKQAAAPIIGRNSLKVDRADRKFFHAPYVEGGPVPVDVHDAINLANEAILDAKTNAPNDSKWRRWNWTLGWAYYEAGNYPRSLTALLQIQNPHDLINKNIIASYVRLGRVDLAVPIARDFLMRNPDYTLAIEDHWPYAYDSRRERWKADLRTAGLPD